MSWLHPDKDLRIMRLEAENASLRKERDDWLAAYTRTKYRDAYPMEAIVPHQDLPRLPRTGPVSAYAPLEYRFGKPAPMVLARNIRRHADRIRFNGEDRGARWFLIAAAEAIEDQALTEIRLQGT